MVRKTYVSMKGKQKLFQKHEFCTKGKVHIMGNFLF